MRHRIRKADFILGEQCDSYRCSCPSVRPLFECVVGPLETYVDWWFSNATLCCCWFDVLICLYININGRTAFLPGSFLLRSIEFYCVRAALKNLLMTQYSKLIQKMNGKKLVSTQISESLTFYFLIFFYFK